MSQHGEELAVIDFFSWRTKRNGVYVEIGALDGYTYSNTVTLRTCLGWSGMLIEGSPRNFGSLEKTLKVLRTPVVAQLGQCVPHLKATRASSKARNQVQSMEMRSIYQTRSGDTLSTTVGPVCPVNLCLGIYGLFHRDTSISCRWT